MTIEKLISYAKGDIPLNILIKNVNVINVLSGEIHKENVGIADGIFIGFGDYNADKIIDADGKYMVPGLIEGHIHIESTLLSPIEFAKIASEHGTATIICDPHEIANVLGIDGIKYMLDSTKNMPIEFYFMAPSCVPATNLETSGAFIDAADISQLLKKYPDRFLGLAEMMNFPGVIMQDVAILQKIKVASDKIIDGHCPLLSGKDLNAYIIAGPKSEHEASVLSEAKEKLGKGMHLFIREGSTAKNLKDLIPIINDFNASNISLVSDDRHTFDFKTKGHLDYSVKKAISLGLNPIRAIQMASINTARFFGLKKQGAIAPGFKADFMLMDDLDSFKIYDVYLKGIRINDIDFSIFLSPHPSNSMNVKKLTTSSFKIHSKDGKINVIEVIEGQILTKSLEIKPKIINNLCEADAEKDISKLAVIERHHGTGNIGLSFIKGLKMKRGAICSTVAHDSHNLIVAGMNDNDMLLACRECISQGGGFVAANNGKILAKMALPIAGLMSDKPINSVITEQKNIDDACKKICDIDNPFMTLSFLSLPVIPFLKLTDKGLVDVENFKIIEIYSE
ncbi:MAG: adenine deaminase [Desulfobacterales bacterium]|nr:adenine deaminase [Desulfobacterales bacterium]